MKTILIYSLCMMFSVGVFAQNKIAELTEVVVIPPKFVVTNAQNTIENGDVYAYLVSQLKSEEKYQLHHEGTSIISFMVSEEGVLSDFNVINSIFYNEDKAIIRAIKSSSGMWKSGTNNGVPTAMERVITLAVTKSLFAGLGSDAITSDFYNKARYFYVKGNNSLLIQENPKKALRKYNMSILYMPNDTRTLFLRGLTYHKLGNMEAAKKDWERIKNLGGKDWEGLSVAEQIIP